MTSPSHRRRGCRGHTLVELVVVLTVLGIIMGMCLQGSRGMTDNTLKLRDRARAVTELRMAVEWLRQDMGGAVTVGRGATGDLEIRRGEGLARRLGAWRRGADPGIVYVLRDGELLRWDKGRDERLVVARGLGSLSVERVGEVETHIHLVAGEGLGRRALTLIWAS